jgi:hypothetical protein
MNVIDQAWSSQTVGLDTVQPMETRRVPCFRFSDFISAVWETPCVSTERNMGGILDGDWLEPGNAMHFG